MNDPRLHFYLSTITDTTDLNQLTENGEPLLVHACRQEWWTLARRLVELGCDVNACTENNLTALQVCVNAARPTYAHGEMANLLRSYGAGAWIRDPSFDTKDDGKGKEKAEENIFHLISQGDEDRVIGYLSQMNTESRGIVNDNGDNLLMAAYRAGMWRLAKALVQRGWSIEDDQ